MSIMKPLRDEHRELLPHVDGLRRLADSLEHLTPVERVHGVAAAHRFLVGHLLPHAEAEEAVLYPAVAQALGTSSATDTMSRDHVEVGTLTAELGRLVERGATDLPELRRVLYGLYALVSVHFAKEEEIYLPLLEQDLAPEEAEQLFDRLGHAAHHAHAAA